MCLKNELKLQIPWLPVKKFTLHATVKGKLLKILIGIFALKAVQNYESDFKIHFYGKYHTWDRSCLG